MKNIILFFLTLLATTSLAQKQEHIVGRIKNMQGGSISYAAIHIKQTNSGTTSAENGYFTLPLYSLPIDIVITSVGYQQKELTITKMMLDTLLSMSLNIVLETKITPIIGVEISAEKEHLMIHKKRRDGIIDFFIKDYHLFILTNENGAKKMSVLSIENEDIFTAHMPITTKSLILDPLKNVHIKTIDSVYQLQIYYDKKSVLFYSGIANEKYNSTIGKCCGKTSKYFISNNYQKFNQFKTYWCISKDHKKELHKVWDQIKYKRSIGFYNNYRTLSSLVTDQGGMAETDDDVYKARRAFEAKVQFEKIGCIPVYAPLFIYNDTIFIFDHPAATLFLFDEKGKQINTVKIDYQTDRDWMKQIYLDEITGQFYAQFLSNGKFILSEIDVKTGDRIKSHTIKGNIYIEGLIIYNHKAYYIRKNPNTMEKSLFDYDLE